MISSRLRWSALLACALLAVFVAGSSAAADDTTSPTASISFSPTSAPPGSSVTITATVTPGTNPDSTGLAVTCNLSWAGLGPSAALDHDASGLVFSRTFTVPGNAVPGGRVGSCTVVDGQNRSSSADYSFTISSPETDAAPTVASHTPADGETDVPVDASIGITFSEPVDLADGWFTISCDSSGDHQASLSGSAASYLLTPKSDFKNGEKCTVTLVSALVTDQDTNDPPDELAGPLSWSFTTVAAPNEPPSVWAGGPYTVDEGGTVNLTASGSDPEGGPLTYVWDLDGDKSYETPGSTVTFSAAMLDGHSSQTVRVQVTDQDGASTIDTTNVEVKNVPPTATFNAPASAFVGLPFALSLTSPQDPSTPDTAFGFTYAFTCGDSNSVGASCTPIDVGDFNVSGTIQDKDGGMTTYTTTVKVTVTFDSLCDLARSYSTDPKVADDLCAKLATAEAATTATAHDGALGAFRNQVDAKTGKGLTKDQADELKQLSKLL